MFMERIRRLAIEWGKAPHQMECVAKESLLYGMRLIKRPKQLKDRLKALGVDSKLATPLWSGNFYLLQVLPQVMCDPRKKIPCLEDYLFARKILKTADLKILQERLANLPSLSRDEIVGQLFKGAIKRQSYRGRFLPEFDRMHEHRIDIQQDLTCEALAILNKEWTNFKTTDPEEIANYLSYCVKQKTNTYLDNRSPRMLRSKIDDEEALEKVVHQSYASNALEIDADQTTVVLREDLRKMLSPVAFQGVALLLNFAEEPHEIQFRQFLERKGMKRDGLSYAKLKTHIERHLGAKVFREMKSSKLLVNYLRG
jgi:hypothetical protein